MDPPWPLVTDDHSHKVYVVTGGLVARFNDEGQREFVHDLSLHLGVAIDAHDVAVDADGRLYIVGESFGPLVEAEPGKGNAFALCVEY